MTRYVERSWKMNKNHERWRKTTKYDERLLEVSVNQMQQGKDEYGGKHYG